MVAAPVKAREGEATAARDNGPALLSTELSLGYLVRETHRAFTRSLQARIAPHGITIGMWFFLRALWEEDGVSQRALSQRVRMMEPTTVTALRNMERRGLVRRVRNEGDRRVINVYLTPKGRALREALLPHAAAVNAIAETGLDQSESEALRVLLGRLRANLDRDPAASGS